MGFKVSAVSLVVAVGFVVAFAFGFGFYTGWCDCDLLAVVDWLAVG